MKLSFKNWVKPSNKKLKFIADWVLYSFPLIDTLIVTTLPAGTTFKLWFSFILGIIVIGFKTFTKFTAEEPSNE